MQDARFLTDIFQAGVRAVRGDIAVAQALSELDITSPEQIIAVGKAATAMAQPAHERFPDVPILIVTKYDHAQDAPEAADVIEAAHPVLDKNSLVAGVRLLDVVSSMPQDSHLLVLVSGGASALAEVPVDGLDLDGLKTRAQNMLASGADIHEMNAARKTLSRIKGGRLLSHFKGASVTTFAISDVEGDALAVIGSGIGDAPQSPSFTFEPRIIASNAIARSAAVTCAKTAGQTVITDQEILYDDITVIGPRLAESLRNGASGVHIWGGEPTVVLPENPGQGGRNQALALLIAREIAGLKDIAVLVAGTDGTDGPTDAAGAIVTGQTWDESGQAALESADAGTWLAQKEALLKTGPTGTNVMDLVIAIKK
ncbi:MAG: DUF4147 domain-containing protein [Roseobacter sp.]